MTLADRVIALAQAPADDRAFGELNTLLDRHLNSDGVDQLRYFLYDARKGSGADLSLRIPRTCSFEPIYIKVQGARTESLATDKTTLLKLWRKSRDRRPELLLRLSDINTQLSTYLNTTLDRDGRIRYSVSIGGSKTLRHAVYASPTGSGYNLHTTPAGHKHLFRADPGYHFFSIDLSGADGWTIGAECAVLGDKTMLDDFNAGIKPAQMVALLYKHGADANTWSRDKLKDALPTIKDPPWLYYGCKKIIWSTCYGVGPVKMSEQILEDSFDPDSGADPILIEPRVCRSLQSLVYTRYPGVQRRQDRINMLLQRDGYLDCANGSRRIFFGKKDDPSTQRDAYAHHPQVVTTWVTSLGWERLWLDPDNRTADGNPIVQPLLLVHDSLTGQFPIDRTDWACAKLRSWFNNPVTIAGTTLTIPYAGHYGPTWAHAGEVGGYEAVGAI